MDLDGELSWLKDLYQGHYDREQLKALLQDEVEERDRAAAERGQRTLSARTECARAAQQHRRDQKLAMAEEAAVTLLRNRPRVVDSKEPADLTTEAWEAAFSEAISQFASSTATRLDWEAPSKRSSQRCSELAQ